MKQQPHAGAAVCVPNKYLYPDRCLSEGLYDANYSETTGDKRNISVSFSSTVSPMNIPKNISCYVTSIDLIQ